MPRFLVLALLAFLALPSAAHGAESWLKAETLSEPGTYNDSARLATNSPGDAAVIWSELGGGSHIRVSTREPNQKWTPSERLSGPGHAQGGAVGVDPQGRITAVWIEGGATMYATKAPDGSWADAQEIPDDVEARGTADLFVASDGTATAVWVGGGLTANLYEIRAARRPPGGAWSEPEAISPQGSAVPRIEGDTAGNVTVSYTHEVSGGRYIEAVDRPNSGPWSDPVALGGPALSDNVSDLVVAPNSGRATVFWQDGGPADQLGARTRIPGAGWEATAHISGGTPGRLSLDARDRAAVDGAGLVTAAWVANSKVLTAYRAESAPGWTAPTPPAEIDPNESGAQLYDLQIASNAFGRAFGTWTADPEANRWSTRGPGPGAPWSEPDAIDGVPSDASGQDLAVDGTGRVAYAWVAVNPEDENITTLSISTYGNPLSNPQPPAPPGPAPPTAPPAGGSPTGGGGPSSGGSASAKARLLGAPTTRRGVAFVVTMPAAGTARILIARAGRARTSAAKFRRLGVVSVRLKKGRNVVRVKRVKRRRLARGRYRATISPRAGGRALPPVRVSFQIRR